MHAVQNDEAVYSPGVAVFRASESQGHVFLSEPFQAAFIACPGIYRPHIDSLGRLAAQHIQQLEQKLDLILKLTACFGHDSIMLGPMGCGSECCWPLHVYVWVLTVPHSFVCLLQHGRIHQRKWQRSLRVCYREIAGGCSRL